MPMFAPLVPSDGTLSARERGLTFPGVRSAYSLPVYERIGQGIARLCSSADLVAIEIAKPRRMFGSALSAAVSDSPELCIRYSGRDSIALSAAIELELRSCGFPSKLRCALIEHLAGLFDQFRESTPDSSLESFLLLRRPRSQSHWHIDHYRSEALQFISTLAGYQHTPFLLRGDYDRAAFERYRQSISKRELECQGLSLEDETLYPLKAGMNQLAHGREPRFVEGDLLFKGEELLHATPASPVARLVFTMSAALPEGKKA